MDFMSNHDFTRRDAIKVLGTGIAVLALSQNGPGLLAAELPAKKQTAPQPFTLPPLDFEYNALEPHIDARTMELHHAKHHQAYIDNANRTLSEYPDLLKLTAEQLLKDLRVAPETIRTSLRNHLGGHVNHSLFWKTLSPTPDRQPTKGLAKAIDKTFGSFDGLKLRLEEAAMKRFGSGWAWLSLDTKRNLIVHSTANQDSPLMEGFTPLLGLDVWEHAYYLHHQNRRQDYIKDLFEVLAWSQISQRYEQTQASKT